MSTSEFERMIVDRKAAQELYSDKHRQILVEMALSAGHVLASHDDATAAHVEEAAGLGLTISEFPTSMEAARAAHARGLRPIMGGPNVVRGGSHSGNASAGQLAEAGGLAGASAGSGPASLTYGPWML